MVEWFLEAIKTNEFMQAAIIAAPVSVLTYTARNIPVKIWDSIKFFFSYDVVFRSDQECYYHVSKIIKDEMIAEKWSRDFTYDAISIYNDKIHEDQRVYSGINIGYGKHWGHYKGHPVIVWREFEKDNQTEYFKEMITIRFIGRSSAPAKMLGEQITEMMDKVTEDNQVNIRTSACGGWLQSSSLSPRKMNTVFTSKNQGQVLLDHVRAFEASRDESLSKGLPWRTGILLEGPPGTGKTSLIHALASETGRDIRFLNLSAIEKDVELAQLVNSNIRWDRCFLVIEDIDVARVAVNRQDESDTVSLSSLLNLLDGFMSPEGLVTIATTNHPEKLDPALTRPGRFDLKLHLGELEWEQAEQMAALLLGENNHFGYNKNSYEPIVGAKLREAILLDAAK